MEWMSRVAVVSSREEAKKTVVGGRGWRQCPTRTFNVAIPVFQGVTSFFFVLGDQLDERESSLLVPSRTMSSPDGTIV